MDGPGLWLVLIAVFAPLVTGAATMLLPAKAVTPRVLLALGGMAGAIAALAAFLNTHGLTAAPTGLPLAPTVNLNLTFAVDQLGAFFALLVSGIGALIVLYARGYFGPDQTSLRRFFPMLGLFATAMMGIVLSDNLLGLFLFWELTTVSSFLLIGWNFKDRTAVRLAIQAFVTTGAGGIALIAGLITMGLATGEWSLAMVNASLSQGDHLPHAHLVPVAFAFIFAGAAAKSAQWPLHFWLPGAMAAPTPVSAYLHSATMVKAGVYLLARFYPGLHTLPVWPWILGAFGAVTMLLGGYLALRSTELKKIFAYTTVSQLGLLVCAYGIGAIPYKSIGAHAAADGALHASSESNLIWPITQILNHALYKAPLFMIAGAIAAATGWKYLAQIKGLWRSHRTLALILVAAAYAMAGLPLTLSFVAKEAFLYQAVHAAASDPIWWAVGVMAVLTAACNVAIFVRITATVFAPAGDDQPHPHVNETSPLWGVFAWLPAAFLVAWQFIGGIAPTFFESIIRPVETSAAYFDHLPSLIYAITHPSTPLFLSAIAIGTGIGIGMSGVLRKPVTDPHNAIVPNGLRGLDAIGFRSFRTLQTGDLRWYLVAVIGALIVGLAGAAVYAPEFLSLPSIVWPAGLPITLLVGLVLLYALVCATALLIPGIESRVLRVLMLGACGFSVTGIYLIYQAPDLALTQIMFELVSVVLFLLVLRLLPEKAAADAMPTNRERIPRALIAAVAGLAMGWTVLTIATGVDHQNIERVAQVQTPILEAEILSTASTGEASHDEFLPARTTPSNPQQLGQWFLDHSYDERTDTERSGGGHNVVNVILVDFRGYDTLGEITVLMIALLGVLALLASAGPAVLYAPGGPQPHLRSTLLRTAMRLILPLSLIFAGYVFFKGHNSPGGGFIAGLIASVALAVFRMSEGGGCLRKLIPIRPGTLGALGLLVAFATAVLPMLYGFAPGGTMFEILRSHHQYLPLTGADNFHFTSVLFFDTGVFMVVVAVAAGLVNRFEEELE